MSLEDEVIKLRKLREAELALKKRKDTATANREKQERKVFGMMDKTTSITVEGKRYTRVTTDYSVIQDREAFVKWAQENDPSLVKYVEQKAEVHKLVRERLDNGEGLPPGLGHRVDEYVSMTAT
jgi:hypothetical protein